MGDEPGQVPPDLTPDSIAEAPTEQYPDIRKGIPKAFVSFKGYLAAEHNGLRRMFCDNSFQKYIEVKGTDIKARIDIPTNAMDSRIEICRPDRTAIVFEPLLRHCLADDGTWLLVIRRRSQVVFGRRRVTSPQAGSGRAQGRRGTPRTLRTSTTGSRRQPH
jgi:hypothetical protein